MKTGLPVSAEVAPVIAAPPVDALTGATTSTVGSLVMVKVTDPAFTTAPLTACRPEPVTKYTVDPAVIDGEETVTVTAGKVPVTLVPFS
jgi:hypothetical protein